MNLVYSITTQSENRKFPVGYATAYSFGYNGKENDNEVYGEGNAVDYGMRVHDPRLGRFLSVDPLTMAYPELTPYQYASDNPIANIDIDGLEGGGAVSPTPTVRPGPAPRLPAQAPGRAPVQPGRAPSPNGGGQGPAGGSAPVPEARPGRLADYIDYDLNGHATFNPPESGLKPQAQPSAATVKAAEGWKNASPEEKQKQLDQIANNAQKSQVPVIKTQNEITVTLYRGVHAGHPDYANAQRGVAQPAGGHNDPDAHNGGNYASIFTSWSLSIGVANFQANKAGVGGLLLKKEFKMSELITSPDNYAELEYLVPGTVTGATVSPPTGPGTRTAY